MSNEIDHNNIDIQGLEVLIRDALMEEGTVEHIYLELVSIAEALAIDDLDKLVVDVINKSDDQVRATVNLKDVIQNNPSYIADDLMEAAALAGKDRAWVEGHLVRIGSAIDFYGDDEAAPSNLSIKLFKDSVKSPNNAKNNNNKLVSDRKSRKRTISPTFLLILLAGASFAGWKWYDGELESERTDWQFAEEVDSKDAYVEMGKKWSDKPLFGHFRIETQDKIAALDAQAFEKATSENTTSGFENYKAAWADGSYLEEAADGIKALQNDESAWDSITKQGSKNAYNGYLDNFPNGKFVREANKEIKKIEAIEAREKADAARVYKNLVKNAQRLLQQVGHNIVVDGMIGNQTANIIRKAQADANQEQTGTVTDALVRYLERQRDLTDHKQWAEAVAKADEDTSLAPYDAYTKKWPKGLHLNDVAAGKAVIAKELKKIAKMEALDKARTEADARAWDDAQSEDSLSAYNDYMAFWPTGKFTEEAKHAYEVVRARDPKSESDWVNAVNISSDYSLSGFVEAWPGSVHIVEAWARRCILAAGSVEANKYAYAGADLQDISAGIAGEACDKAIEGYPEDADVLFAYAQAIQLRGEDELAQTSYEKSAAAGHPHAIMRLADRAMASGDVEAYIEGYTKAADAGHMKAIMILATGFERGEVLPYDIDRAAHWYEKAGEKNYKAAIMKLVRLYSTGNALEKDLKKAFYWLLKAAQFDEVKTYNMIAQSYEQGKGTLIDIKQAVRWYEKAEAKGDDLSLVSMSMIYAEGKGNVAKDIRRAHTMFVKLQTMDGRYQEQATEWIAFLEKEIFAEDEAARIKAQGHPDPLTRVEPIYPRSAKRDLIEGMVKLSFTITKRGRVDDETIVRSNPIEVFDRAAMRALNKWRFTPLIKGGVAVDQLGKTAVFTFTLPVTVKE